MRILSNKIARLAAMLAGGSKNLLVLSHYNPDGDAVGASLAWMRMLEALGHNVTCVVPNKYPYFLDWMAGIDRIRVFAQKGHEAEISEAVARAEVIFCLDFNTIERLENFTDTVVGNTTAKKVLIDHHLDPPGYYDLSFSCPDASSTSEIVFHLISRLAGVEAIERDMATALYVGITTDTGNFSYGFLTPELFRAVGVLVKKGIDIPYINYRIYNSYNEWRVRLLGYAIGPKMEMLEKGQAALISLKESELHRFHFKQGDSEGFVNYPLSIATVKMSALFLQTNRFIRVSLRSRGEVDVNLFARRYFNGGGHKNAAGGKSTVSMEETLEHYRRSVAEYFRDEGIAKMKYEEKT
jgi:phosphoesterase RecJ-like protein